MKRFVFTAAAFLFCSTLLKAQVNFQPGTIVTLTGETRNGQIDYREWKKNPRTISFKSGNESNSTEYSVATLAYFEITGKEKYIRAAVRMDMRPVEMIQLTPEQADTVKTDTVFLREIFVNNKVSLYLFSDFKSHFFIKETGADFEELAFKVQLLSSEKGTYLDTKNLFRGQLQKFIGSNPNRKKIESRLKRLRYTEHDLTDFLTSVTGNANNDDKSTKTKPDFFLQAGMQYSALKVSGNTPLTAFHFSNSVTPLFGAGIDFKSNRNFSDFVFRIEATYSSLHYKGTHQAFSVTNTAINEEYLLKINNITPAVSLLYHFIRTTSNRVYVGVGSSVSISGYTSNEFTKNDVSANTTTVYKNYYTYEKAWLGISASAGTVIKNKLEINASAKLLGTFSDMLNIGIKPGIYSLRAIYRF